jgi:hypothetical protein
MPATVFTLCDTLDQEGYGCSSGSAAKVGSLLLQVVAIHVNMKRNVTKESLSVFYDTYSHATKKEDTGGWTLLDTTIKEIALVFGQYGSDPIDPHSFLPKSKL